MLTKVILLSMKEIFNGEISFSVITLKYLLIKDSCYEVRQKFSIKLHKALEVLKLPLDYLAFFMLSAVDPCKDRRAQVFQVKGREIK